MTNQFGPSSATASLLTTSLLSVLLFTACGPSGDGEQALGSAGGDSSEEGPAFEGAIEKTRAVKVLTAPLIQREMVRALSTTVNAESESEVEIFPRTTGVVTEVAVEEGDRVAAGDTLMRLDQRELESALAEARVTLREAEDALAGLRLGVTESEANANRAKLTFKQSERELARKEEVGEGVVSRNEMDQLRLTVETNAADVAAMKIAKQRAETAVVSQEIAIERAELQLERAQLDLSYATTVAPFDGVIAQRTVRQGDMASSSAASFVLTDTDHVRAVVSRPQRELAFFRAAVSGDAEEAQSTEDPESSDELDITIEPEALPGFTYTGHIQFVSPTIDAASGQFRVTLGITQPGADEDKPPVLPGMLLRVRIVTERHLEALVVPKRALIREGDNYFVIASVNGMAQKIEVTEGFADDDNVEVFAVEEGALEIGADIIVVGNRDLEDGDAIEASVWPSAVKATSGE